jgi:hypothetical protein
MFAPHLRVACLVIVVAATPARAQTWWPTDFPPPGPPDVNPYSWGWYDPRIWSRIGVGFTLGAAVTGFTSSALRESVRHTVGEGWAVRLTAGTHIPLGLELGYFGSVSTLRTLNEDYNGLLFGTVVEAAVRWTILPRAESTPYLFIGAGWQGFNVHNLQFPTADTGMSDSASVAEFPMGAGIAYRDPTGWVADLRATFRATTSGTLLREPDGGFASLASWEASGSVGYEF